ncbi:MAG: 4Fe-4S binding protein [Oscillospiraceae bacterium]|nr:4Fe-4S binding protein [Oscillospiraceae bacterium]
MAYKISDECIACGACMDTCPTSCIAEGEKYSIKESDCISCGACADVCPVSCISE